MSRLTLVVWCATVVVVSCLMNGCDAHRVQFDDLDVAASDHHHEWKKGEESDHHDTGYHKHGKKGEKGYDEKHG